MENATTRTPSQPCGAAIVDKLRRVTKDTLKVVTFPKPQRKFTDLGTEGDQKGEYIAAGEGHAAVPPTKSFWKGFQPSVKDCFKSFLFVLSAWQNDGEASLRKKVATETTSCP